MPGKPWLSVHNIAVADRDVAMKLIENEYFKDGLILFDRGYYSKNHNLLT